jgi:DUF4097 and DUF4098 domain-containing protein YvlB
MRKDYRVKQGLRKAFILLGGLIIMGNAGLASLPFTKKVDETRDFRAAEAASVEVEVSSVNIFIKDSEDDGLISFRYYGWSFLKPNIKNGLTEGKAYFHDHSRAIGDIKLNLYLPKDYRGKVSIRSSSGCLNFGSISLGGFRFSASSGNLTGEALTSPEVVLQSSSGNATIGSIQASAVEITRQTGNLKAREVAAESVSVVSTSGSSQIEKMTVKKLQARLTSGRLAIKSLQCAQCEAKTTSGKLELGFAEIAGASVGLISTSGAISLSLPRLAKPSMEIKSVSGSCSADFPLASSTGPGARVWNLQGNDGDLSVQTTSGSVEIRAR